jgi:Arc/MetJ-type ribon-helix-helix transcriptional regulator
MSANQKKPQHRKVIRINVTLPPALFDAVGDLVLRGGYTGLSDYFQAKIRRDAKLDPEDKMAA